MSSYSLEETRRQLLTVPDDIEHVLASLPFPGPPTGPGRIVLAGSGDSRAAARIVASEARDAGMDVSVVHPWQLSTRAAPVDSSTTVVLISASGTSDSIVAAAESIRGGPATTIAVTGKPGSRLAEDTARVLPWRLSPVPSGPSPAVRTFAATYLALSRLLGRLPDGAGWAAAAKAALSAHIESCLACAPGLLGRPGAIPTFCATGRHRGAAEYARSKVIEISGLLAVATDPDEWFHVDRHAAPPFGPMAILTDDTMLPAHVETVLRAAAGQGRQVAVVAPGGRPSSPSDRATYLDTSALGPALRPLAGAVLGVSVALHIAEALGRRPFGGSPG